jgi:hypothetical protein
MAPGLSSNCDPCRVIDRSVGSTSGITCAVRRRVLPVAPVVLFEDVVCMSPVEGCVLGHLRAQCPLVLQREHVMSLLESAADVKVSVSALCCVAVLQSVLEKVVDRLSGRLLEYCFRTRREVSSYSSPVLCMMMKQTNQAIRGRMSKNVKY